MRTFFERMGSLRAAVIRRIANLVVEHPKRALLLGVLFFALLAPGVGRLYQNIKYYIWFQKDNQQIKLLDEFEQRFGSDLNSVLVVHSPSGIFDKDSAKLLIELTDRMWKTSETIRVESLVNFPWVHPEGDEIVVEDLIPADKELTPELLAQRREAALHHEQLPGFLVSKDGKSAAIYAWLRPTSTEKGKNDYNDFVANRKDIQGLAKEFAGRGDHTFYVSGFPVLEGYLEVGPPTEMQNFMPVILGTCMVLCFLFFRRASGVLLPLAVVIPGVLCTLGLAGWTGTPINPMTITAPNLMVIIGIASTDNILHSFFRALDAGMDRKQATRFALDDTLWPTLFACITIAIGFLSLVTMTIPPMQQLGFLVAAGTMFVWVLNVLFLGPLMVLAPIRRKKRKGGEHAHSAQELDDEEKLHEPGPRAIRLVGWIDRNKIQILIGWAILCGVSIWLAIANKVNFDPTEWYDKRTDERKSIDFIKDNFGTSETFEIIVESGQPEGIKDPGFLKKVDAFSEWLRKQDKVVKVFSLVDILKDTNRALFAGDPKQYKLPDERRGVADEYFLYTMNLPLGKNLNDQVTLSNDALRLTVLSGLKESPVVLAMSDRIDAKAKEMGLKIKITGRGVLYHHLNNEVVPSFFRSMFSGTLWISIVLLLFFRSLRLGFLSLVTNLIPILVGAGPIITLLGKNFDMATISTFVIALGVSVDDTCHFLEGYDRYRKRGFNTREALARLWTTVGPAMFSTALILGGCFGLFAMIVFPVIRYMGVIISLILVVNFLADFILGPAILLLWKGNDGSQRRERLTSS
jgi:predicted RND superfamily exporter protein